MIGPVNPIFLWQQNLLCKSCFKLNKIFYTHEKNTKEINYCRGYLIN